ncbi:MAG: phospholipase D-like domain-containing protein, partial [Bryobacteraceae bacterium]
DRSRYRYLDLIRHARRTLRIIDHRVTDPEILEALKKQRDSGVDIEVKGWGAVDGLVSHGKMMLVDDETAVIGSISMSTPSLDLRREVAIVIRETACLASLRRLFGRGVGLHEAPPAPETEDDEE